MLSLRDENGKIKPWVMISAVGLAVIGLLLLASKSGGGGGVTSGGQSSDLTGGLNDLTNGLIDLQDQQQGMGTVIGASGGTIIPLPVDNGTPIPGDIFGGGAASGGGSSGSGITPVPPITPPSGSSYVPTSGYTSGLMGIVAQSNPVTVTGSGNVPTTYLAPLVQPAPKPIYTAPAPTNISSIPTKQTYTTPTATAPVVKPIGTSTKPIAY